MEEKNAARRAAVPPEGIRSKLMELEARIAPVVTEVLGPEWKSFLTCYQITPHEDDPEEQDLEFYMNSIPPVAPEFLTAVVVSIAQVMLDTEPVEMEFASSEGGRA